MIFGKLQGEHASDLVDLTNLAPTETPATATTQQEYWAQAQYIGST